MEPPLRKSVPLSPEAVSAINRIRTRGTDEAEAATELVGLDITRGSEAQALAAVIDLGFRLIEERAREESYRRLVAIDGATGQERRARADRRAVRERRRAQEQEFDAEGATEQGAA